MPSDIGIISPAPRMCCAELAHGVTEAETRPGLAVDQLETLPGQLGVWLPFESKGRRPRGGSGVRPGGRDKKADGPGSPLGEGRLLYWVLDSRADLVWERPPGLARESGSTSYLGPGGPVGCSCDCVRPQTAEPVPILRGDPRFRGRPRRHAGRGNTRGSRGPVMRDRPEAGGRRRDSARRAEGGLLGVQGPEQRWRGSDGVPSLGGVGVRALC